MTFKKYGNAYRTLVFINGIGWRVHTRCASLNKK